MLYKKYIMKRKDNLIFSLIGKELKRQREGIELIASENFTSLQVMEATGSVLTNKYAEGYPKRRYYGGCEVIDEVEQCAIDRLKQIFNVEYANVQPHSGSQANVSVVSALLKPGDKILGLDLSMGGHLTHGSPVNFSGKIYQAHFYTVEKATGLINYDLLEEKAKSIKPKLIICGASAYSRDFNYAILRNVANKVGAFLMADIAHPAGLIAKNILSSPFPYCDIVTSTTHKTLRGPRGGIIMMKKDFENPFNLKDNKGNIRLMSNLIDMSVFPGNQGGPLEHIIAAKAIAFGEILTDSFTDYANLVVANSRKMASLFQEKGYTIVSGGTDNHLFLIDLHNKKITGKQAEQLLTTANITTNKNMIPYDDQSPFITSGIRLGTAALTTRGLKEENMIFVVEQIDKMLSAPANEQLHLQVKADIIAYMKQFPLYPSL